MMTAMTIDTEVLLLQNNVARNLTRSTLREVGGYAYAYAYAYAYSVGIAGVRLSRLWFNFQCFNTYLFRIEPRWEIVRPRWPRPY